MVGRVESGGLERRLIVGAGRGVVAQVGAGVGPVIERAAEARVQPQRLVQERQGAGRIALLRQDHAQLGPQRRVLGIGLDGRPQGFDRLGVAVLFAQGVGQGGAARGRPRGLGREQAQQLLGDLILSQTQGHAAQVAGQGGIVAGGGEGRLVGVQRLGHPPLVLGAPGGLHQRLHLVCAVHQARTPFRGDVRRGLRPGDPRLGRANRNFRLTGPGHNAKRLVRP